jgi:hypothetical protein
LLAPGRRDIVKDADAVVADVFSKSFSAPHLFGARLAEFERSLRAELATHGERFWDWPGDTFVLLGAKPPADSFRPHSDVGPAR